MKPECADAARKAAGTNLSDEEIANAEKLIREKGPNLARQNPAEWRSLSNMEKMDRIAQAVKEDVDAAAATKQKKIGLEILTGKALDNTIDNYINDKKIQGRALFSRLFDNHPGQEGNSMSLQSRKEAIHAVSLAGLNKAFRDINGFAELFTNKENQRAFIYAIKGRDAANIIGDKKIARTMTEGAKRYLDTVEELRQRFNAGGGTIGKLEEAYLPQKWHSDLVGASSFEEFYNFFRPRLDEGRYINAEGNQMSEPELRATFNHIYESIRTGGANKLEPGQFAAKGEVADRYNEHRYVHLRGPDDYIEAMQKYGASRDIVTAIQDHISALSRDIARIEMLGPNADAKAQFLIAREGQRLKNNGMRAKVVDAEMKYAQALYDEVSGRRDTIFSERGDAIGRNVRSTVLAARIGGATISNIPHEAAFLAHAWSNGLPVMKIFKDQIVDTFAKRKEGDIDFLDVNGLTNDHQHSMISNFVTDEIKPGFSDKSLRAVTLVSGLDRVNHMKFNNYAVAMSNRIGQTVRTVKDLAGAMDRDRFMSHYGVTDKDFSVWKLADQSEYKGSKVLTISDIYQIPDKQLENLGNPSLLRRDAVTRLMAVVNGETRHAVNEKSPSISMVTKGMDAKSGTQEFQNQVWKSLMTLKTWPLNMMYVQWSRAMSMPTTLGKLYYAAILAAGGTLGGYMTVQAKSLLLGKDPLHLDDKALWIESIMSGGGSGIFGDVLLNPDKNAGDAGDWIKNIVGPVGGAVADVGSLVTNAIKGDVKNFGKKAVNLTKDFTPGANIWYLVAAWNRLVFTNIQNMINPSYGAQLEGQALSRGQRYYVHPSGGVEAPDLSTALPK